MRQFFEPLKDGHDELNCGVLERAFFERVRGDCLMADDPAMLHLETLQVTSTSLPFPHTYHPAPHLSVPT